MKGVVAHACGADSALVFSVQGEPASPFQLDALVNELNAYFEQQDRGEVVPFRQALQDIRAGAEVLRHGHENESNWLEAVNLSWLIYQTTRSAQSMSTIDKSLVAALAACSKGREQQTISQQDVGKMPNGVI